MHRRSVHLLSAAARDSDNSRYNYVIYDTSLLISPNPRALSVGSRIVRALRHPAGESPKRRRGGNRPRRVVRIPRAAEKLCTGRNSTRGGRRQPLTPAKYLGRVAQAAIGVPSRDTRGRESTTRPPRLGGNAKYPLAAGSGSGAVLAIRVHVCEVCPLHRPRRQLVGAAVVLDQNSKSVTGESNRLAASTEMSCLRKCNASSTSPLWESRVSR